MADENPLKMMKNAFYFTLKALFVHKIFKFLSGLRKIKSYSKIMTSQPGEKNNYNAHDVLYTKK